MPGTDTITVYRGEDVTLGFTMNPIPSGGIAGWTLLLTVEGDPETPKLIAAAGAVTDGPNGKFDVALDDGATLTGTDKAVGHYKYDVWRTDAGSERLIALGTFIVDDSARFPE